VFDRIVNRTRSRLDVPTLRTLFDAKQRPDRNGSSELSLQLAAMIETPRYDLTLLTVHFGLLTVKAYTTGDHVPRFEAITHNTKQLRCGRVLDRFPEIISKLTGMVDRFTTALDCVDVGFLPEDTLDQLPLPSRIGATRIGGIDLNTPRIRSTLAAVLALAAAPGGFTVQDLTTKVHTMTGHTDYTTRQAAYDLRTLRGKDLLVKPGRSRRYHLPPTSPDHHRPAHPARAGHQPHPHRHPQPTTGTQTHHLDPHRPRLRNPPHQHANPLPRPRYHHPRDRRSIDNFCRSGSRKRLGDLRGQWGGFSGGPRRDRRPLGIIPGPAVIWVRPPRPGGPVGRRGRDSRGL
jgi:hypothetical protein